MKEKIHPKYKDSKIECACGNVIETRSTRGDFKIDICSACHPFFTGKQKLIDSAGRVERFRRKYGKKAEIAGLVDNKENTAPAAQADEKA